MEKLKKEIAACCVCEQFLAEGCNPLVEIHPRNKILIIGHAPGLKVHRTGRLWEDKSGDNLRRWLGVDHHEFYHSNTFGLMPMGFCYPGKAASGDHPPRPECAPLWHHQILEHLDNLQLTLLVGKYAQNYYLQHKGSLTETVRNYQKFLPQYLPLPHPSPRNFIWQGKNPWFQRELVPRIQEIVQSLR